MYSSRKGSWSKLQTATRNALICKTVVEYGKTGAFDAIVVAAGFDHCVGETMGPKGGDHKLWTIDQVKALGYAVHESALHCRVLKSPVSVLEGGYKPYTMNTLLPSYVICSTGTDV
jgi:acetoin utilization deacetylase AcuC-like enzyme